MTWCHSRPCLVKGGCVDSKVEEILSSREAHDFIAISDIILAQAATIEAFLYIRDNAKLNDFSFPRLQSIIGQAYYGALLIDGNDMLTNVSTLFTPYHIVFYQEVHKSEKEPAYPPFTKSHSVPWLLILYQFYGTDAHRCVAWAGSFYLHTYTLSYFSEVNTYIK